MKEHVLKTWADYVFTGGQLGIEPGYIVMGLKKA